MLEIVLLAQENSFARAPISSCTICLMLGGQPTRITISTSGWSIPLMNWVAIPGTTIPGTTRSTFLLKDVEDLWPTCNALPMCALPISVALHCLLPIVYRKLDPNSVKLYQPQCSPLTALTTSGWTGHIWVPCVLLQPHGSQTSRLQKVRQRRQIEGECCEGRKQFQLLY